MDGGSPDGATGWLLNILFGVIMAVIGGFVKLLYGRLDRAEGAVARGEERRDDMDRRLVKVETTSLSAEQIRAIIAEHTLPINQAHTEIFVQLRDIHNGFTDLRVEIEKRLPREDHNKPGT